MGTDLQSRDLILHTDVLRGLDPDQRIEFAVLVDRTARPPWVERILDLAAEEVSERYPGQPRDEKGQFASGAQTSHDVGPDDSRVGDGGVTEANPYPFTGDEQSRPMAQGNEDGTGERFRSRLGKCYELSGRYLMDHRGNANLVHGSIEGLGNPRIKHAWVEVLGRDGKVTGIYEPITNAIQHPASFGAFFNAHVDRRYPAMVALAAMVKIGHFGPWDE